MTDPAELLDGEARPSPADVATAWVRGWIVSRTAPPAVDHGTHFTIPVGLPGHAVRHVFPALHAEAIRAIAHGTNEPGTWLKIVGAADEVRTLLPAEWVIHPREYLMHTSLAQARAIPDAPPAEFERQGDILTATLIAPNGERAARAQAAIAGTAAIFDQVVTEPGHRRKGYGSVLMSLLAAQCRAAGATLGVLVATEDGRGLYSALGWQLTAEVTAASYDTKEGQ